MDLKGTLLGMFVQYAVPVLFTGLAGIIVTGLTMLAKKWAVEAKDSAFASAGSKIATFAATAVTDLEATLRPQLELAAKDGTLSPADYAQLRKVAVDRLLATVTQRDMNAMGVPPGQVATFLGGVVEQAVARLPSNTAAPVAGNGAPQGFQVPGGLLMPPGSSTP